MLPDTMGYVVNSSPPRRWFCGRLFLERARDAYELTTGSSSVGSIILLFEARLNVVRGIRASLRISPDPESFDEMLVGIQSQTSQERFDILDGLWSAPFEVVVVGTNRYGHEFDLKCRSTGELISAKSNAACELIDRAVGERRSRAAALLSLARTIFFYDVYKKDKRRELLHYDNRESLDTSEVLQVLVDAGRACSIEDAAARYGTRWPFQDPAAESIFQERQLSNYKAIHDEEFWDCEEGTSIGHQFVD